MRIGLRSMEVVEWENEGDSTHEKVVRFAWECVAWGVEWFHPFFAMILFENTVTIKQRVMNDDV